MSALRINPKAGTLVVGLGSSHGDDQAGWKVIDQLEKLQLPGFELHKASIPLDIIDWLDGQRLLHVIDACVDEGFEDKRHRNVFRRFEMIQCRDSTEVCLQFRETDSTSPTTKSGGCPSSLCPTSLRSGGSHQIDALAVLELAASLGSLPDQVFVWCIPGIHFAPGDTLSADCEAALLSCELQLTLEFGER